MNKNTKILTGILTLSNVGWLIAYAVQSIDHGISLTYQDASLEMIDRKLDQALVVANSNLVGQPLNAAKEIIRTDSYGLEPFIKEGCLYAGGLCLEIGPDSKIVKVRAD